MIVEISSSTPIVLPKKKGGKIRDGQKSVKKTGKGIIPRTKRRIVK